MGKYEFNDRRGIVSKNIKEPHPIWRGIGCLTAVLVPVISYALADATIKIGVSQNWSFLPYTLIGPPRFPDIVWNYPKLAAIAQPITTIDNLYANIFLTAIFIILFSGIGSLVYAIVYRFIGPPRYGPQDIPPPNIKTKKYKR